MSYEPWFFKIVSCQEPGCDFKFADDGKRVRHVCLIKDCPHPVVCWKDWLTHFEKYHGGKTS